MAPARRRHRASAVANRRPIRKTLARAKWLALYGDPERATWARLLPGDDPSKTLRGGGYLHQFLGAQRGRVAVRSWRNDEFFCPAVFDARRGCLRQRAVDSR